MGWAAIKDASELKNMYVTSAVMLVAGLAVAISAAVVGGSTGALTAGTECEKHQTANSDAFNKCNNIEVEDTDAESDQFWGTLVAQIVAPAVAAGVATILLGAGGMCAAGKQNKCGITVWTVFNGIIIAGLLGVAYWTFSVGSLISLFVCGGYDGATASDADCFKQYNSINHDSFNMTGCADDYKPYTAEEIHCDGNVDNGCICFCKDQRDLLCVGIAGGMQSAGIIIVICAIICFIASIFGCCICCCNKEKDRVSGGVVAAQPVQAQVVS